MHASGIVFSCEDIHRVRANGNALVSLACWVRVTRHGGGVQRPGAPPLPFSPVSFYSSSEAWSVFTLRIYLFIHCQLSWHLESASLLSSEYRVFLFFSFKICQPPFYYFFFFGHLACGMLVPQPGIEPAPPVLKRQHLNN